MMMRKGDEAVRMRRELATAPVWPTRVTAATAFAREAYLEPPPRAGGRILIDEPEPGYCTVASGEYNPEGRYNSLSSSASLLLGVILECSKRNRNRKRDRTTAAAYVTGFKVDATKSDQKIKSYRD